MIPVGVIVQKFYTFRVAFHRINQAFEQIVLISAGVQFPVFISQQLPQAFQFFLGEQDLLFCPLVMFL